MQKPLGAQISHMLKGRGVDFIFGIPGVHNQEMYRGIEEAGITHVLARHEQGAGFMADGYARATGKFGVAYVITGPGFCNIMTPMGQAYSDSVPMLVIASCLDETEATRGQLHQMLDQAGAGAAVCEWSLTAGSAGAAYALVDRAFAEFQTKRARPKAIHVPIAQLEALAEPAPKPADLSKIGPLLEPNAVPDVLEMLQNSQKPVVVFGGGAAHCTKAQQFLEQTGALAFATYAGGGVIASDHPQYLGSYLARPESADIFEQADFVLALGTELAEVDLWRPALGGDCPIVRVDIDPEVLAQPAPTGSMMVQSDVPHFLSELIGQFNGRAATGWGGLAVSSLRNKWRAEVDAERPSIVPMCDALQQIMPDDAMIYSDMTQFAYVAKEVWDMPRPAHWHHPSGFGTLGYALPAAIGGAVARRGRPTLAIAGDYGFQYTVQELGTAVELGLSLPIILWDNGKLKEIEDSMRRAQIAPNAVIAHNPDFTKLADAYGALSTSPTTLTELQKAVLSAFDAPVPTLIYVTPDIVA